MAVGNKKGEKALGNRREQAGSKGSVTSVPSPERVSQEIGYESSALLSRLRLTRAIYRSHVWLWPKGEGGYLLHACSMEKEEGTECDAWCQSSTDRKEALFWKCVKWKVVDPFQ